MPVRIVTDSTADLPPEVAKELGITVVPLNVHMDGKTYRDGIDIQADEFYQRLPHCSPLPTTSQPSAGVFLEAYQSIATPSDAIVSIHISSKLSGTCNSALLAKGEMLAYRIEVIDSQLVSMALGLVAIATARAARQGQSLEQVCQVANNAIDKLQVFALIDTLDYLEKGGRLGKAQAFLGSLLQVKPIITLKDGEVHPVERARTRAKAMDRLVETACSVSPMAELAICHSAAREDAEGLAQRLAGHFSRERTFISQFGPVLGTYVGPKALGVVVQAE
jgi:DegV family protein with EDD domain